jgi:1,2-phenylacetyl-CoA epoxidase catalytic subunit
MDSREFAKEIESRVAMFCISLHTRLPAYSYVPLTRDEQRVQVMKSRLFNEIRAGEIFGSWLKTTPEMDVKAALAEAIHEEFRHAEFLEAALKNKGAEPYDYRPVPAQMAMFNAFESLSGTVERMAAFPLAGEGVADYLIRMCLKSGSVPEWVLEPYRKIHEDEETHGNYPAEVLAKYVTTEEQQDRVRRAVEMSLMLRRQYFENLDRWVFEGKPW